MMRCVTILATIMFYFMCNSMSCAQNSEPTKDETIENIKLIVELFTPCETDGNRIRRVRVEFGNRAWQDSIRFFVHNTNERFNGDRELGINLADTGKDPDVEKTDDGFGYKVTFNCRYSACTSPGPYAHGSIVLCADDSPDEPRKTLDRLLKALGRLWDLTPRLAKPPY
jgi:hypothetical protein